MLKMLITLGKSSASLGISVSDPWRGIASCKASRGVQKHLVTSGVAWRPLSNTGAAQ